MFKKQNKIIFILGLVIIALFFTFSQAHKNILPTGLATAETKEATISTTLIVGNETFHLASHAGQFLYDALLSAKENGQIIFSGKNYPALGFFVTDINSLHSGNGKYLFYYINGKEASVGVSSYPLKDGDIIKWKLK